MVIQKSFNDEIKSKAITGIKLKAKERIGKFKFVEKIIELEILGSNIKALHWMLNKQKMS